MRERYGDAYPDVKRLKAQIAKAKEIEAAEAKTPVSMPGSADKVNMAAVSRQIPAKAPSASDIGQARERIEVLKSQIALTDKEIASRKAEQERIIRDVSVYQ